LISPIPRSANTHSGERDGEDVVLAPTNQVEVVVVDNVGGASRIRSGALGTLRSTFGDGRLAVGVEVGLAEFHGAQRVVIERIFRKRRPAAD
jgi:hypothetical protein